MIHLPIASDIRPRRSNREQDEVHGLLGLQNGKTKKRYSHHLGFIDVPTKYYLSQKSHTHLVQAVFQRAVKSRPSQFRVHDCATLR